LKDDAIFELARLRPKMKKDLARARSFPTGFERSSAGAAILSAIAAGREIPQAQLPEISRPERYKPSADILELLKVLLKRQCEHYRVAPKLVASAADLEEIARDDNADVPALKGWRREVFGDAALRLKRGEIALRLKNGSMEIMGVADA
jgi:ribonuclease D